MHVVFPWRTWLTGALFICAGLGIAAHLLLGMDYVSSGRTAVGVASFLALVFTTTPVWRMLWWFRPVRDRLPLLDGDWSGEVTSNWTVISALRAAAKQAGDPPVDVDNLNQPLPALGAVKIEARIRATFFGIELALQSADSLYQQSRLRAVVLKPAKDGYPAVLDYLFEARVLEPVSGDSSCFDGAGSLTVKVEEQGIVLEGPTWTNRSWTRGLNTAGVIRMTRTSDPGS